MVQTTNNHEHDSHDEYNQTDAMITTRDNGSRLAVAVGSVIFTLIAGYLLGKGFAAFFKLPGLLGTSMGLGLSGLGLLWLIPRLYVINNAVSAFVTIDLLTSELVTYGPGFHFCFPWEKRSGSNAVDLSEAAENFSFEVQTPTGNLKGEFSIRLRPDITRLPQFLSGVASVAADIGDIIKAYILTYFSEKPLINALKDTDALNKKMEEDFKHGKTQGERASEFEKRFGVILGDITVSKLMPSGALQETMSAQTESTVIDSIVAASFGKKTMEDLQAAVDAKIISQDEVNRRRNQTMAMSGNLQGMDFSESTFNLRVSGLDNIDPAIAEAIAAAGPLIAKFAGSQKAPAKKAITPRKGKT